VPPNRTSGQIPVERSKLYKTASFHILFISLATLNQPFGTVQPSPSDLCCCYTNHQNYELCVLSRKVKLTHRNLHDQLYAGCVIVSSFLSIFSMHIPSPPCMLHAQQVPTSVIPSPQRYLAKHATCAEAHYATCPILQSTVVLYVHINSNINASVYLEVVLIFTFHLFSCLSAAYLETTTLCPYTHTTSWRSLHSK